MDGILSDITDNDGSVYESPSLLRIVAGYVQVSFSWTYSLDDLSKHTKTERIYIPVEDLRKLLDG